MKARKTDEGRRRRRGVCTGRSLLAVIVAGVALVSTSGPVPADTRDLETVRAEAQAVADEVSALERTLADLGSERRRLAREIDATNERLAHLHGDISDAEAAYQRALDAHIARAVDAYKAGSRSYLALFLSAQNLTQMMTIAEARGQIAEADSAAVEELDETRAELAEVQGRLELRKGELMAAEARIADIETETVETVNERRAALEELMNRVAVLEEEARREAERLERIQRREEREEREEREAADAQRVAEVVPPPPDDSFARLLEPAGPTDGIPEGFVGTGVTFEGVASWYGPGFEGNLTANGDVFDSSLFTAASLDLPLGSWLYVRHKGRGVLVLVNDRGPYIDGRILDLSRAAAEAIGITGLGWIKAEVVVES